MKAWQQRLADYRQKLAEHDYMKDRIEREIRDRAFDVRDPESRFTWALRPVVDSVTQCRVDLQDWEERELPATRQYEQSEQFKSDVKLERLELLEKREYENKYHIEVEKRERQLRMGYGRDWGWETGSVILAMCQGELDELNTLRTWRQKTMA